MAQKKKPSTNPKTVLNRRARFDYELEDDLVVGMSLNGPEVRAARNGHVQLKGSFVTIRNNELWLNNASFSIQLNKKNSSQKYAFTISWLVQDSKSTKSTNVL